MRLTASPYSGPFHFSVPECFQWTGVKAFPCRKRKRGGEEFFGEIPRPDRVGPRDDGTRWVASR